MSVRTGQAHLAMSQLHYETLLLRREGLTRDLPSGDNEDLR